PGPGRQLPDSQQDQRGQHRQDPLDGPLGDEAGPAGPLVTAADRKHRVGDQRVRAGWRAERAQPRKLVARLGGLHACVSAHHLASAWAAVTSSRSRPQTRPNSSPYCWLDRTVSTCRGRPKMLLTSMISLIRPGRAVITMIRSDSTIASSMECVTY